MYVIRVDPDRLDEAAEKVSRLAKELVRVLENLHMAASSAPSYDGDFGPKVARMSLEGLAQAKAIAARLGEDAQYLSRKAREFREADLQSQSELMAFGRELHAVILGLQKLMEEWPPPPAEPEKEKEKGKEADKEQQLFDELLKSFWEEVNSPGFRWAVLTDRDLARLLMRVSGLPDFTIALPVIQGVGPADLPMPLLRQIDSDLLARAYGRMIGDASAPQMFLIGWGLTLAPEQVRNIELGAPWNERVADGLVDTVGFLGSEAAGWVGMAAGTGLGGGPILGLGGKFAFDLGAGVAWDLLVENYGLRDSTSNFLAHGHGSLPSWGDYYESLRPDVPRIATPQRTSIPATGTPAPPAESPAMFPSSTPPPPTPSPTSEPPAVIVTQTPEPPGDP